MKTIKFIAYLFYRYYSTGPRKQIAYLSSLLALVILFVIHLFQIMILFNLMNLVPTDGRQTKIANWIQMALFMLPIYLLFRWLIKEDDLKALTYGEQKIKKSNIWLVFYIIVSVALLILLILYKKGKL